jgi:Fe-S cluster assembly protein SufB
MSKYTEDDLKLELETKEYEYGFYTIRIGYISYA